jgi:hypothetical protein
VKNQKLVINSNSYQHEMDIFNNNLGINTMLQLQQTSGFNVYNLIADTIYGKIAAGQGKVLQGSVLQNSTGGNRCDN